MLFRNLTLFRFPPDPSLPAELEKALPAHARRPVAPLAMSSRGWVSPYGRDSEVLQHGLASLRYLVLGSEDRLLPPAVVNEAVAEKVATLSAERGRAPGARERKRVRDEVLLDLMPRAFVRPSRLAGYLDAARGWLVIDSASRKAAEAFVSHLRDTLGSFAAVPLDPAEAPRAQFTGWMRDGDLPKSWQLGEECELRDPVDRGAVVKCRRQDLAADEVREHLKAGKQVSQLEFVFDQRVAFVLDEALVLRKLRFLDTVTAELEGTDRESQAAELDARFAVMSLTLAPLFDALDGVFKLAPADVRAGAA